MGRFLASIVLLAVASGAWAQVELFGSSDRTGHFDFSVQTRYVGSRDFDGDGRSRLSIADDLGWGFNVGYNVSERFNVGGSVSWRTVDYDAHFPNPDILGETIHYSGWMDTGNIALNGTWNVLANRFTPFLQGSVGVSMVDTNVPGAIYEECWWDPWLGYTCLEYASTFGDDVAAYTLGAGVNWQLTEIFLVRVGYERLWLDLDTAEDFDVFRLDVGFLYR